MLFFLDGRVIFFALSQQLRLCEKKLVSSLETEVVVKQFTLQEVAKFKAAGPDDVVFVRVCETIELIEQNEQLLKDYARVSADKVRLQEDNVRLEEEIAEYKSKFAVLEQRISDLDRSSKLNSHNSSKPPSSDGLSKETVEKKKEKEKRTKSIRKKSDRKSGGQAGHKGTTLNQVENPDQIVDHTPDQCPGCSATLSKSDIVGFSSRQVFDIPKPPPLVVTEHRGYTCQCKECGAKVCADFPDGVNAPVQYV